MKTIFNKIDPTYLDCASGLCEHTSHQFNLIYVCIVPVVFLVYLTYKKYLKY